MPQEETFYLLKIEERAYYIPNGVHLASATVPWHWLFFCLAMKVCYKNLPRNFPISFEASKWHWLILASIGALVHIGPDDVF